MSRWSSTGERIPVTLFELAAYHHSLKAQCRRCRHEAIFSGAALWWLFECRHWPDHLDDVPRRLRCKRCGHREARIRVVREAPTIDSLPLPTDYAWKKAVARYRA